MSDRRKVREFINEIRERVNDFTFDQIHMIERGLLSDLPLELLRFCVRPDFNAYQMINIIINYKKGFSLEQLQKYVTPQINEILLYQMIYWAEDGLDLERFIQELGVDLFPKISGYLMFEIRDDLLSGLSWERIKEFIQLCKEKNCLNDDGKIKAINKGILAGLTKEEIDAHIKSEHDSEQVEQIIEKLVKKKENEMYKNEETVFFIKLLEQSGRFDERQLREIRLGLISGLTVDQVRLYADEKLFSRYMRMARLHLQAGHPKEQIRLFLNLLVNKIGKIEDSFKRTKCENEISLWLRDGLPLWFFDYLLQYHDEASWSWPLEHIIQYFDDFSWLNWWRRKLKGLPKDQVDIYFKKVQSFITVWEKSSLDIKGIAKLFNKLPDDQIEVYSQKIQVLAESYRKNGFDGSQIPEIILGYLDGLSEEQIRFYAKREFSDRQMREIRLAYLDGLTQEEIEFLANPKFEWWQMKLIRLSFKFGLSLEQVKKFTKPEYDKVNYLVYSVSYMEDFFLGYLWGLPEEAVKFYMTKLVVGKEDYAATHKGAFLYFTPHTILRIALLKGLTIPEIEFIIQRVFLQNSFQSESCSLSSVLDKFATDKKARAKVRSLISLNNKLKENWKKNTSEIKNKRKDFTL